MKRYFDRPQLVIAIVITVISFLGIISQQLWSCIKIDEKTIFLIALSTFPWMTLFFKKFKFPGFEGESHDRDQSTTETPIPPEKDVPQVSTTNELTDDSKKILATLWRYQKQYFKDDYTKRWTFLIFATSPEYTHYVIGLGELLSKGLVSISPGNNQVQLTNEGIIYMQKQNDIQNYPDIYTF